MMTTIYLVAGLVLLVILSIIGILTRYRKCRSDEVLVVYGKTSGNTSAKCYHGGSSFVIPVLQGYAVMSMKPLQIQCDLNGALSAQKIKVNVSKFFYLLHYELYLDLLEGIIRIILV